MWTSPIYWGPLPYRITMRLMYGRSYLNRYRLVDALLPNDCGVVEICCGCGFLYEGFLANRGIQYVGIDMLERMLSRLKNIGVKTIVGDALTVDVDQHEYCVMLGSLYHFHPNEARVLQKMAKLGVRGILLEPVVNFTASKIPLVSRIARILSYIQGTSSSQRIDSEALDKIIKQSGINVISDELVLDGVYRLVLFST